MSQQDGATNGSTTTPTDGVTAETLSQPNDTTLDRMLDTTTMTLIAERLLFFFSDANIRQDAFMRRYMLIGHSDRHRASFPKNQNHSSNSNSNNSSTDGTNYDQFIGSGKIPIALLLKFHTIQTLTSSMDMIQSVVETESLECQKVLKVVSVDGTANGETKDESNSILCIERIVPFTKDMLHGHIPVSLYVYNLPLTPDGMKYDITMTELRDLFTPLVTTLPSTTEEDTNKNNNDTKDGVALIKFKFKPRSSKSDSHANNNNNKNNTTEETNDSGTSTTNQKWVPTGGAMIEFANVATLQRVAEQTVTVRNGENNVAGGTSNDSSTSAASTPKYPLYYHSKSNSDNAEKVQLQVMLYSEYHKKEKKEYSNSKAPDPDNDNDATTTTRDNVVTSPAGATANYTIDWKPGCVIRIQGISNKKSEVIVEGGDAVDNNSNAPITAEVNCDRECILEMIAHGLNITGGVPALKEQKVVYVDYSRGQDHGAIRFTTTGGSHENENDNVDTQQKENIQTIYQLLQQLVVPSPSTTTTATDTTSTSNIPNQYNLQFESVTILSGDEEIQYWNDFIAFKNQQLVNQQGNKRNSNNNGSNGKRKSSYNHQNNNNKRSKHGTRRH